MTIRIIQGGMGVGVSGWPLARAVSRLGQMGVVSGTGLAVVLTRRLATGDEGGHMRRALEHFPVPAIAQRVLDKYFVAGGIGPDERFASSGVPVWQPTREWNELTVLANFAEVWLAKEGHEGVVGINYLEKMQIPTLASLLGAMLADVDCVLMGAGIPRFIPGILDAYSRGQPAELRLDVQDAQDGQAFVMRLDPADVLGTAPELRRPKFLAIVSSAVLATTLARKSNGRVDGFIVEGPTAGGHNAPPRGPGVLNDKGEPVYGPRDQVDLAKLRELGLPFWLAGGYGTPQRVREAIDAGAQGVQVGTAFAFCDESSTTQPIKQAVLEMSRAGRAAVFTDPNASPTGFPFKVVQLAGTLSEPRVYDERERICDLGYLRTPYRREDGTLGYRCPAEPQASYQSKGGDPNDTPGRKCLCNALFGTIGLSQSLGQGRSEPAIVTAGDDVADVAQFIPQGQTSYSARDVIDGLLNGAFSAQTQARASGEHPSLRQVAT
jgi:nitronate monooxygenase